MSKPKDPDPAKLFLSMIYREKEAAELCLQNLAREFGPSDYSTRELLFDASGYYAAEMGEPLFRRFFTFRELMDPGRLAAIKLFTNQLEQDTAREGKRRVNLDPGFIAINNLVLATGKAVAHRPYLGQGIYADLTLVFENGTFRALPWTYCDYASPEMLSFLNRIREAYKADLKQWRKSGSGERGAGDGA